MLIGRALSAIAAFVFCGVMSAIAFVLVGDATGWLTVRGPASGALFGRLAYAAAAAILPVLVAVLCARAAWKSGQ